MTATPEQPSHGCCDGGTPPMPALTARPFDWGALVADVRAEARESRRAVEKRTRRLAAMNMRLRKKVEENAGTVLAIKELDEKIENAVKREKCLLRLITAAKRRKAQLQADVEEAETRLEKMTPCHQQSTPTAAVASVAVKNGFSGVSKPKIEDRVAVHGNCEMGNLQHRLHVTRLLYRRMQEENKQMLAMLADLNFEENLTTVKLNEHSISNLTAHHFEFSNALQDLIQSFKEVTCAAYKPH
ncbi:hypothetical protein MOQ_002491 [Trypanosoma cruzi marinkellei]|uniref:Uncharacterized protein n=1 Tax=Trypanosoma cruzi marinkellei TaxID=85056 RepID=K2NFG4_TRYCR|nr:hypothetical protein MOQ_002491 [Trypanosoma cruzi marinkellei]